MSDYKMHFQRAQSYYDIAYGPLPNYITSLSSWVHPRIRPLYGVFDDTFYYTMDNYFTDVDWATVKEAGSGNLFKGASEEAIREFFHLLSIIEEEKGEEELASLVDYNQDPDGDIDGADF